MEDDPPKSVSSLRSRFEHMATTPTSSPSLTATPFTTAAQNKGPAPPPPVKPQKSGHGRAESTAPRLEAPRLEAPARSPARGSLELSRKDSDVRFEPINEPTKKPTPGSYVQSSMLKPPAVPSNRPRPLSLGMASPKPPVVTIESPKSPPKQAMSLASGITSDARTWTQPIPSPRSGSPRSSPSRTPPPVSPRPKSVSAKPTDYFSTPSIPLPERSTYEPRRKAPLSATMQALRDYPGTPPVHTHTHTQSVQLTNGNRPVPPVPPVRPLERSYTSLEPQIPPRPERSYTFAEPPLPARPERSYTSMDQPGLSARFEKAKLEPISASRRPDSSLAVEQTTTEEHRISPFSTPPSSDGSPNSSEENLAGRVNTKSSKQVLDGSSSFAPPPTHHSVSERRLSKQPPPPPANPPKLSSRAQNLEPLSLAGSQRQSMYNTTSLSSPMLPPRAGASTSDLRTEDNLRSNLIRGRSHSPIKSIAAPLIDNSDLLNLPPPPKRITSTLKTPSPNRTDLSSQSYSHTYSQSVSSLQRASSIASNTSYATTRTYATDTTYVDDGDASDEGAPASDPNDYPDSSGANRRRPVFTSGPREINCKYDVKLFAVCGQYVCTTAHTTKVWDITTGENIMSLHHGETARISAIAFKPSKDNRQEGSQLWLGTQTGELMEIDIPSQKITYSRTSAHTKKEVVKIHRHGYELWSLDDSGKLQVWPPDVTSGVPHLANSPRTMRLRPGHSYSLISGSQLWVASGRDVSVYQPSADVSVGFHLVDRPIQQLKPCGEVTSGAIVNSIPDTVFFGHIDGKVSIYSCKTLTCTDVVSVSLYRINSMSGVGDYLWAGFQTGMVYVYDVRTRPWKVLKDWKAHERPVTEVVADRTSIWKIDRLQVLSLSSENIIRVWDGLLEQDWLEEEMQKHDTEFCTFRQIKALVCTWNAGASKPQDLSNFKGDDRFIENVLSTADSPDIIVFGFQELVDLENKKITAKSFFKGKKSEKHMKEGVQEHMSRQYRLWQEYLTVAIERYMPVDTRYQLLHAANLVGLFTCVFVKASERGKVRSVGACTVKTGLKGYGGNKGGLVIRFLLDDTSLCFINCHLAAGQSGVRNRNKDVADILESSGLSPETDVATKINSYIGGGDGSMILDHEICILNGDLNYRINHPQPYRESVIKHIRDNDYDRLIDQDQLLIERKKNPGFRLRSFNEDPITFAPTYKYDVGTDKFDSSEKRRMPSWCDRILYRGLGRIKQLDYRRHEVHTSDHRPVSGVFALRLKTVSRRKREEVLRVCEQKYEEVKQSHVYEAKLDFLVNVCGFPMGQAQQTLDREARDLRK